MLDADVLDALRTLLPTLEAGTPNERAVAKRVQAVVDAQGSAQLHAALEISEIDLNTLRRRVNLHRAMAESLEAYAESERQGPEGAAARREAQASRAAADNVQKAQDVLSELSTLARQFAAIQRSSGK